MSEINLKESITFESIKYVENMVEHSNSVMLGIETKTDDPEHLYLIYRRYHINTEPTTNVLCLVKRGCSGKPCFFGNLRWFVFTAAYSYIKEKPHYMIDQKNIAIPVWLQFKNLAKWCLFQSFSKKLLEQYE